MTKPKIAVTGIGIVSPLGPSTAATWENLLAGKSGIDIIQKFDASDFPTRIAAEVKNFQLSEKALNKRLHRNAPSFAQYACEAAYQAIDDSGTAPTKTDSDRWGIVVGSGMMTAEHDYWQAFHADYAIQGEVDVAAIATDQQRFFTPSEFAKTQVNGGLALLAQQYGITGYCNSVHTACASGGQAMGLALRAIQRDECDVVLAGGFDSMINPYGLASFCLLGAVSPNNDDPQGASRPFDAKRDGFVLGEGAAFLILEKWERAVARGATIYAQFAGEGNSLSSYRITDSHPSGDGAIQAIAAALRDSHTPLEAVDYINAHGTSTKMNDHSESNAIKQVFGEHTSAISVSSTKSLTGHLIAAAGAIEAAFSVLAIAHGTLPINANYENPDPDCDLSFVTDKPKQQACRAVLSNSFGFGGSNSSLVFHHPEYSVGDAHV